MRAIHRIVSLFVVLVTFYLGVSGSLIQFIDFHTLFTHAPPTDPNMMAIREDHDGTNDFAVIATGDYLAPALPAQFDYQAALPRLLAAASASFGSAPLDYAEIRMGAAGAVGQAQSGRQLLRYDFNSGQSQLWPVVRHEGPEPVSIRNTVKHLHRMTSFGDWALWINPIVGICLGVFIVTGVVMYWRLLAARRRAKRPQWFWVAGGWWRTVHRWVSIVAALFISVVALSGSWLAYESLIFGYYMAHHRPAPGQPRENHTGVSALPVAAAPAMLATTLQAYQPHLADKPLKVLRLRVYGGMPQGIVIGGLGDDTEQFAFNALNGRHASLTEPGYPEVGFPFGWQAHQYAKQIHRGDFIGLSGRWMDLFAGLSIIYLSLSGAIMYFNMWQQRRRSGRKALIWT
jgi:hypothetical protein